MKEGFARKQGKSDGSGCASRHDLILLVKERGFVLDSGSVQETVIAVWKAMPGFAYHRLHGSFKSWLLRLASWRIGDELRKRRPIAEPERSGADENSKIEQIPDPAPEEMEASWDEEWKRSVMETAIRRVRRKANPEQYQLFDLFTRKGWSVEKISEGMKVGPERVYMAKHRIKRLIELEVKSLQGRVFPK